MEQTLEATSDVMTARSPSFRMPYAIAGPLAALAIAIATWCFGQSERLTKAETEIRHLATSDQVDQQTQKLEDFEQEYRRDRLNDQAARARGGK
jgi:hypothetical protein